MVLWAGDLDGLEEPEHRRRFFDMVGTTTDPGYLRVASEYRRALEQRNAAPGPCATARR